MACTVTFLISTYNRRDVLLRTLRELDDLSHRCGIGIETIVVDNASTDGTADAVASQFPAVRLFRERKNRGACAKNIGLARAQGEYIIFLDDDSYPIADSVRRMVGHFQADRTLGAAVFRITLPDGSQECSAYPSVFIGCGTGFRRDALMQVGGLPEDYFMQAEEYDLSIRLLNAGWNIERFDDLHVTHLKTPNARVPTRTTRLDVRNNLTFVTRYLPREWVLPFAVDWMRRYAWIAQTKGWRHQLALLRGVTEGILRSLRPGHRRPVSAEAFEQFSMIETLRTRLERAVHEGGYRSILLLDVGKNILPYWMAAQSAGVRVVAIADARLARAGRRYRGVPVVDDAAALRMEFGAAIVSNSSPVHAQWRAEAFRAICGRPVIDLMQLPKSVAYAA